MSEEALKKYFELLDKMDKIINILKYYSDNT
jgi:hypothetical protein